MKEGLSKRFKEHPASFVAVAVILVVFVTFSVYRFVTVHSGANTDTETEDAEEIELTDEQSTLASTYDTTAEDLIDLLCRYAWVSTDGSTTATFTDASFSSGGTVETYAIQATTQAESNVDDSSSSEDASGIYEGDSAYTWTASLLLSDGSTALVTITPTNDDQGEMQLIMEMPEICDTGLEAQRLSTDIDITSPDPNVLSTFGVSLDDVENAVTDFVAAQFPTVSTATWMQSLEADYSEGTLTFLYQLDDSGSSLLEVVCSMEDGTVDVEVA